MRIFYIITTIILIYLFLKIKKSSEQQNPILWILVGIIVFMCYNAVTIFILSAFDIKSTLFLRGIINFIISLLIYLKFMKNKIKQLYCFDFRDLIPLITILLLTVLIGINRFDANLDINFETTDPSVHFINAKQFYNENKLNGNLKIETIYGKTENVPTMFAGHVNVGTIMQLFDCDLSPNTLYKVFIVFELFIFYISGMLFYMTIKNTEKIKIRDTIFLTIATMIYLCYFPLSNLLFGFHYLGVGVLIINLILLLIKFYYTKNTENKTVLCIINAIALLTLFFTYYLFVPALYFSVGLYILYMLFIEKQINFKQAVYDFLIMLIIPFVIGFTYFFICPHFNMVDSSSSAINVMKMEGYIYRNLIGSFIVLLPIVFSSIIIQIKAKKISLESLALISITASSVFFFILVLLKKASTYYFYKFHYVIWLLLFLILFDAFMKKNDLKIVIKVSMYIFLIVIFCKIFEVETEINKKNYLLNPIPFSNGVVDLVSLNYNTLKKSEKTIESGEHDLLKYVVDNKYLLNEKQEILLEGDVLQKLWAYSVYGIIPVYKFTKLYDFYEQNLPIDYIIKNKDLKYFIVFYDNEWYLNNKAELKKFNVVYKNKFGVIYSK